MADARIDALTEATSLDDTDWLVAEVGDSEARKVSFETLSESLPGFEYDYVQITSPVAISATSAATANTCITANAVAFDGSTRICIEVYAPYIDVGTSAGSYIEILLYDGSDEAGVIGLHGRGGTGGNVWQSHLSRRYITPSAASHTYSVRAYRGVANGAVAAGNGVDVAYSPAYIRITKA